MRGGYAIGKASRATLQSRHRLAQQKAAAQYDRLMKSDKPFCPKCGSAYYLMFKREEPEPGHPYGWGSAGTYWVCAHGRKKPCYGGPCKFFSNGNPQKITIRPRDEYAYKMEFSDVIKSEIAAFRQNLPQITTFFSG